MIVLEGNITVRAWAPRELLVTVFVENKKCACFTSSMELLSSKASPDAILVFLAVFLPFFTFSYFYYLISRWRHKRRWALD